MLHLQKSIPDLVASHNCNRPRRKGDLLFLHGFKWEHADFGERESEIFIMIRSNIYIYNFYFIYLFIFYHGATAGSPKAMCAFQRKEFTPQLV
jgi:hypothetical protein